MIAVRASIVARAKARDVSIPMTGDFVVSGHCRYQVASNGGLTFPTLTAGNVCKDTQTSVFGDHPQQYTRSVSSNVIQIRNRVRG